MHLFGDLEFRDPWLLSAALLAIPIYLLARRTGGRLLFSSLAIVPRGARSLRARLAWLPPALLALATAVFGVALAGPRTGDHQSRIHRQGIAIMMVVDISGSMRALDLSGEGEEKTRLDAVKSIFGDFVVGGGGLKGRPDDAVGVVSFARYADSRCPLTLDHDNLMDVADELQIVRDRDEDGTALGDGLGLAVEHLRDSKAKSKVAILLTDGVQNAGEMTPLQAAKLAEDQGIKVYTIGAGRNGWAPVRVQDPMTGQSVLRQMPVQIDEDTLKKVAEETGGRYFRATDAEGLRDVYQEIDRLERSRISEVRYLQYHELFEELVALALVLAALGWILGDTWLRRLP